MHNIYNCAVLPLLKKVFNIRFRFANNNLARSGACGFVRAFFEFLLLAGLRKRKALPTEARLSADY